jgi:hypothetical protein
VYQSRTTHHVIARKERSERRGNPLDAMDAYRQCDSLPDSQWIATGFRPRDDKVGKEWGCAVRFQHDLCHCEEGTQVTDAAIHCMQWTRTDCAVRFSAHSGSPRAFTPRDDKVVEVMQCTSPGQHTMSLRGKSEARDAAIHWMQWTRTDNTVRFPTHSGSPRATPSR